MMRAKLSEFLACTANNVHVHIYSHMHMYTCDCLDVTCKEITLLYQYTDKFST